MPQVDIKRAEAELRGTTLRVYWQLFKTGRPSGVREIQRAIGMSSPSTALYHLEKLRELGVVGKDEYSHFYVNEDVKVGVLRLFLRIGKVVLPRYLFYGVFFLAALVIYLVQSWIYSSALNVMALVFGFSATLVSWYELTLVLREKLL